MLREQIAEIEREIASLPMGNIVTGVDKAGRYVSLYWVENGKIIERKMRIEDAVHVDNPMMKRVLLLLELKKLKSQLKKSENDEDNDYTNSDLCRAGTGYPYRCSNVCSGKDLYKIISTVLEYKQREIYPQCKNYVLGGGIDKAFFLYGLRLTGKTTILGQVLSEMKDEMKEKTAYVSFSLDDTIENLEKDIDLMINQGLKCIILDEPSLIYRFDENVVEIIDKCLSAQVKLVVCSSDYIGLMMNKEFLDRCILLNAGHISYSEFETVFFLSGVQKYIHIGGSSRVFGDDGVTVVSFAAKEDTEQYIREVIIQGVENALISEKAAAHFPYMFKSKKDGNLAEIIRQLMDEIIRQFTIGILSRDYNPDTHNSMVADCRPNGMSVYEYIYTTNLPAVIKNIRSLLMKDKYLHSEMEPCLVKEIEECFLLMGLTQTFDIISLTDGKEVVNQIEIFTIPGLIYSLFESLLSELLKEDFFDKYTESDIIYFTRHIRFECESRILEDIIINDNRRVHPERKYFSLRIDIHKYDVVIQDPETDSCEIYVVRNDRAVNLYHYAGIKSKKHIDALESRYGKIKNRYIIYNGESNAYGVFSYRRASEYLIELKYPRKTPLTFGMNK